MKSKRLIISMMIFSLGVASAGFASVGSDDVSQSYGEDDPLAAAQKLMDAYSKVTNQTERIKSVVKDPGKESGGQQSQSIIIDPAETNSPNRKLKAPDLRNGKAKFYNGGRPANRKLKAPDLRNGKSNSR